MKRDMENLDLRNAFGPMPAACHDALMQAARSVREDEKMKRMPLKTVLIALCLILATMSVAVAAGNVFGWTDFFGAFYQSTTLPTGVREILNATEETAFTLGKATYRVQQLYADRHIAMASVQITMTDGSPALICMDGCQFDPIAASGENGRQYAQKLGVDPGATWMEAAKALALPLYQARGILDITADFSGGEEMEDALYDADGHFVDFSMLDLDFKAVGDTLPISMFLRIAEIDVDTGEEKNVLSAQESLTLAVSRPTETCAYEIPEEYTVGGLTLKAVRGELTPAGLYLYTDFTAREGLAMDDFLDTQLYPEWYDESGKAYGWGISMTYHRDTENWPQVSMMGLISVDAIPDTLVLALEDDNAPGAAAPRVTLTK